MGQYDLPLYIVLSTDKAVKKTGRLLAQITKRLADRRKTGTHVAGKVYVIKAQYRNVLRYTQSFILQRPSS
jgi:hypothetical protein